jgi:hypothetical protein
MSMIRPALLLAAACFAVSSVADAQTMGGGGYGGGGGHGGGGRHNPSSQPSSSDSPTGPVTPARPVKPPKPISEGEIVGVVKAVDPDSGRITIAYEAIEARNWPAGVMAFTAYKSAVLKQANVGEKIRFKLDGQQITEINPF